MSGGVTCVDGGWGPLGKQAAVLRSTDISGTEHEPPPPLWQRRRLTLQQSSSFSECVSVNMHVILYYNSTTTQTIFMRVLRPFHPLTSRDRGAAERGPRLVFAAVQWTFVAALMVRLC